MWNMGSSLRLVLRWQIATGLVLSFHYKQSFDYLLIYMRDIISLFVGAELRYSHANRASLFIFLLFIHVMRRIYYRRFFKQEVWKSRIVLLLATIRTRFIRYVLPWRQMSYWGATVIINLASVVPIIGPDLVIFIWRRYVVVKYTLVRFYSLHFLLPFVVLVIVLVHIEILHKTSSGSPVIAYNRVNFFFLYFVKDFLFWLFLWFTMYFIVSIFCNRLGDVENFIAANPLVTPLHIIPEWYFLFAYAILRCIPNKTVRVLGLLFSILLPIVFSISFSIKYAINLTYISLSFLLLTFLRRSVVEWPYVVFAQLTSIVYFLNIFLI